MSQFDARFYDFTVHPVPDSMDSISRLAFEAKRLGYSGIAIVNSTLYQVEIACKPENFSIHSAVELACKPSKLREEMKKNKEKILIIKGGEEDVIREAVETWGLDILLQPATFNHVLAKEASHNSIILGFNMSSVIHMRGEARVRELTVMRSNLKYARKYSLRMILASDSYSCYDLRSPREMAALASIFGMTTKEAVDAMSTTPALILRRKNPEYIQDGVEVL